MANKKSTGKSNSSYKKTSANRGTSNYKKTNANKSNYKKTSTSNKKNNVVISDNTESSMEITKLVYIIVALVVIIALFYLLTYLINKNKKYELQVTESIIQYSEIMVGEILNRSDNTYYVLATLEDDPYMNTYKYYLQNISDTKIYTINLNDMFNKNYIADDSNFNITNLSEIRFKESTLIKVSNNKINTYYEGNENIVNEFKNM